MRAENPLPVGVAEIAERLRVRQQTVAQWKLRGLLPPARWTVSRLPAWNWPDIERWAAGRTTLRHRQEFEFRLYVSLDGTSPRAVEAALRSAGAETPIQWREHRTLVTFRRAAANYSEAVAFVVNQLPRGAVAEGVVQPF
jgi:hypothetical protein